MQQKQRLFIYDRKEMGVLILLGITVAIFAFTLGVHLGKKVGPHIGANGQSTAATVKTVDDSVPNPQELNEQSKGVQQAADEALDHAAHDEVARTGLKLEVPRQVELPEKAVSANAGATQTKTKAKVEEIPVEKTAEAPSHPSALSAADRSAPLGRFTLQIGSHRAIREANEQVTAIEGQGFKPYLRPAEIRGKGKWYRVYLGGYSTREAAEQAGNIFRSKHLIDSFIVAKMVDH